MGSANHISSEDRSALFRLAWDFIGSALGGRNTLYERFYLGSTGRGRKIIYDVMMGRRDQRTDFYLHASALVDRMLAAPTPE